MPQSWKFPPKAILLATGFLVCVAWLLVAYFWNPPEKTKTAATPIAPPTAAIPAPIPKRTDPPPLPPATSVLALADRLNNPDLPAAEDVRTLFSISDSYFTNLQNRQGYPIRDDIDLVKVLCGRNPLRLVLLPSDHRAISPEGRLLDRWGTPYFIHAQSSRFLEIHSAGPDKIMFTTDDLVAPAPQPQTGREN